MTFIKLTGFYDETAHYVCAGAVMRVTTEPGGEGTLVFVAHGSAGLRVRETPRQVLSLLRSHYHGTTCIHGLTDEGMFEERHIGGDKP